MNSWTFELCVCEEFARPLQSCWNCMFHFHIKFMISEKHAEDGGVGAVTSGEQPSNSQSYTTGVLSD